jgi:hypothetical protein
MLVAVLIGALLSAAGDAAAVFAVCRHASRPVRCSPCWAWCNWPCVPDGRDGRSHAQCAEASLLSLLEVVFGVAWAWLGAGEAPSVHVLGGGALVLMALVANEALALRAPRATGVAAT